MKRLLPQNKTFSSLVLDIFSFLYEKDEFKSFETYSKESIPKTGMPGETIVQLYAVNSGHRLTGLFLKSSLYSVQERNRRRAPRWFEKPFSFKGEQVFLSSQWNSEGEYQLTLDDLNFFLKLCYYNKNEDSYYKVLKNDELFEFYEVKKGEINEDEIINQEKSSCVNVDFSVSQKIFFGTPGTGKSYKANEFVNDVVLSVYKRDERREKFAQSGMPKASHYADVLNNADSFGVDIFGIDHVSELEEHLKSCEGDDKVKNPRHSALRSYIEFLKISKVYRTTFHPDYDYAQFVGSYKPKKENGQITYSFVPQVFAKAYAAAWKNLNQPVYLVIEEINRGNCAQIFGDLFQLLDRKNGESEYPINADADFGQWLVDEAKVPKHEYDENGCVKIMLPPNFNILATMNTSDQSLFPMDSAFKRRFDWEYVPIDYKKTEADFTIVIGDKKYRWLDFLKKVNADIYIATESEDKQMGEFFVKPSDGKTIDLPTFCSKVLFYLWDSVYKDDDQNKKVFRFDWKFDGEEKNRPVTFQSLFEDEKTKIAIVQKMMENLDVPEKQ
ncbi:MAG: AAA family ATPase [Fibrobacter sp.]|nr:AAA family ATPase [Fibrobacter sp.]